MKSWIQSFVFMLLLATVCSKSVRRTTDNEHRNESSLSTESDCNCDWRFLRHYEAKRCRPLEVDECGCPTKYGCPSMNEIENIEKVCLYKGKVYEVGTKINTTNICQMCKCLGRKKPRIFCIPVECPLMDQKDPENCSPIYEKNSCCPVRYECGTKAESEPLEDVSLRTEIEAKEPASTCQYKNSYYPLGARIYPDDNPCLICECTLDWNATTLQNCYHQDCVLERNKIQLDAGCIPIYHESRCCPIEFHCPSNQDDSGSSPSEANPTDIEPSFSGTQCIFGSNSYDIGEDLPINHTTNCVKCSCVIPPDFTCVHQSCPPPDNAEFCISRYSPDQCCPQYDCALGDSPDHSEESDVEKREMNEDELNSENPCADLKCDEGRRCMLYLVSCGSEVCPPVPTCLEVNYECETAVCGDGCVVVEQNQDNCLTCACGENINRSVSTLRCRMPHCVGQNCRLVSGEDGCPTCSCDEPCSTNECPPGCNVLLSEGEGRCPRCVCEDETEGCPTPLCEDETCKIETPNGGCPTCICGGETTISNPQMQHQQDQLEESMETEGHLLRESEEDVDDIRIMTREADNQPENELNAEVESDHGIKIFSSPQTGGRQP